ncbi:hypothetical protein FMEAI12_6720003 [Parafrankia sp. Ea1.12]|nr:hypothetical protein FMEAI12_6720003 [Parafrankia sp. Ea1.12]
MRSGHRCPPVAGVPRSGGQRHPPGGRGGRGPARPGTRHLCRPVHLHAPQRHPALARGRHGPAGTSGRRAGAGPHPTDRWPRQLTPPRVRPGQTDHPKLLWGARSRPGPVSWADAAERTVGMMVSYVHPPALSDLRAGVWLAGSPRPLVGVQGHRAAGAAT